MGQRPPYSLSRKNPKDLWKVLYRLHRLLSKLDFDDSLSKVCEMCLESGVNICIIIENPGLDLERPFQF